MGWLSDLLSAGRLDWPEGDAVESVHDLPPVVAETKVAGPPPTPVVVKDDFKLDAPRWERHYTARLDHRCVLKITAADGYFSFSKPRGFEGTLIQPNGRTIYFDPERIADKIIDPVLVPLIQKACADIFVLDAAFCLNGKPDRIRDAKGQVWVRA